MASRLSNRFLNQKLQYVENGEGRIEIPRDNPIRAMMLYFTITVKGGASNAPTGRKNNHYQNLIKKIKLERDGSENKFAYSGITKYLVDWLENGIKPWESDVNNPAAGAEATYEMQLQVDFAQVRRNPSDFTALLNNDLSSLDLIVEWNDIDDVFGTANGATVVAAKTYCEVEIMEAFDNGVAAENDPGIEAYLANGLDYKELEETVHAIEQKHDSFDLNERIIDVKPVPTRIVKEMWRCLLNITDGDPSHSNEVVTHFKFANVRGRGESIWRARFKQAWAATKQLLALDSIPVGVLWFDWLMFRQGGFRNNVSEASKIKLLTNAPASGKKNGLIIWRRYLVTGQIGG